jgi:hypothetical protein
MQIKTTLRCHLTCLEWLSSRTSKNQWKKMLAF